MAAGFVLAVGTFAVLRPGEAPAPAVVAQVEPASPARVVATAAPAAVVAPTPIDNEPVVADIRMIRDARLDRYLAAHKQFAGSSALGVPSAFLRSATVDTAPR
jgi:sigma-E factor negative regulatory protein RseA